MKLILFIKPISNPKFEFIETLLILDSRTDDYSKLIPEKATVNNKDYSCHEIVYSNDYKIFSESSDIQI